MEGGKLLLLSQLDHSEELVGLGFPMDQIHTKEGVEVESEEMARQRH